MKKFFKFISMLLLFIIILASFLAFMYRGKIKFFINAGKKYSNFKNNVSYMDKNSHNMTSADYKNIIYKKQNGVSLTLDIYKAKKDLPKGSPVILYVHGGAWVYGDKNIPSIVSPLLDIFRDEGFTIISVEYELMKPNVSFSKPVSDVKDAIRWIHKNKDIYGFNENEIGVLGISAGSHLGLLASYSKNDEFLGDSSLKSYPCNVKYMVDFIGPTDLKSLDFSKGGEYINNILNSLPNMNKLSSTFSPINYVKKGCPKTLMIYSENDNLVPYENGLELYDKCKANKVWTKLVTLHNKNHNFSDINKEDLITLSKELLIFIVMNSPL